MRGVDASPTRKAREKFKVAREERNIPRRRSEKDLMRVYCWAVGVKYDVSVNEANRGKTVEMKANIKKTEGSIWAC